VAIELDKATRERLIASIQRYFTEHLEQDIGHLKASLLLDFALKEVGPSVYNLAVGDAQTAVQQMVSEIDGTCFEREFGFWKR
jgi:uncharacterized protein (DUF2164 family)